MAHGKGREYDAVVWDQIEVGRRLETPGVGTAQLPDECMMWY